MPLAWGRGNFVFKTIDEVNVTMRKTSLTVAIGFILTTTSSFSFAQDATLNKQLEGLKKQIEVLQQRLNAVEVQS